MHSPVFVSPDTIRARFSRAMSDLYKREVPLYGRLLELVAHTNAQVMQGQPELAEQLRVTGEIERLDAERHGAIRLGTAAELSTIRRLFAVMGMRPVGYYDLAPAGVPVHSTAFRAVHEAALQASPFRVFTSLLRLELIEDAGLRRLAAELLARRRIFTPRVIELIGQCEVAGGLLAGEADEFIGEALQTFRWHSQATVSAEQYRQLHGQHRLIADVVAFKGPHINHLTPRTLDIDAIQAGMPRHGITPKAVIEGPPRRNCPILLRQTSFKALQEAVAFIGQDGPQGSHTARFGEIEQRGAALTAKGRELYDRLLDGARQALAATPSEANAGQHDALMAEHFRAFPDDHEAMRRDGLAYFRYFATPAGIAAARPGHRPQLDALVAAGHVRVEPLVYEDFLPVSAAGIFQSNLGEGAQVDYASGSSQADFEAALGARVEDELSLYADTQRRSLAACAEALRLDTLG
ncbi:Uncharacterized metalloenzyme YdcJ, glyoxalase superfamily [Pseudomonas flavescens]|uniref:2-oxoadipate dioxygenase/decarboxylase n=1 Tax=Phytopseudomonas flavescens TaxID=29435 RepID=A0A1G8PYZ0_9GAMM|nr:VOC family protein [Pseudomonas flavescens]SDI97060.1 Uncharacterized metalloenzyme YdcJ, glyoxalase superfamily [Pseudomonas flavescens]